MPSVRLHCVLRCLGAKILFFRAGRSALLSSSPKYVIQINFFNHTFVEDLGEVPAEGPLFFAERADEVVGSCPTRGLHPIPPKSRKVTLIVRAVIASQPHA
jgi:hypothetical protein